MAWLDRYINHENPVLELLFYNLTDRLFSYPIWSFHAGAVWTCGPQWTTTLLRPLLRPALLSLPGYFLRSLSVGVQVLVVYWNLDPLTNMFYRTRSSQLRFEDFERQLFTSRYVQPLLGLGVPAVAFAVGKSCPKVFRQIIPLPTGLIGIGCCIAMELFAMSSCRISWKEACFSRLVDSCHQAQEQRRSQQVQAWTSVSGPQPSLKRFQYTHLTDLDDVRLLRVRNLSLESSTRVVCDLIVTSLRDAPPYEAVSYCWGDEAREVSLVLGSEEQSVLLLPRNASRVLQYLTPSAGSRYLWIDSICINQDDVREKEQQIPLMRQIFEQADQVIGCLETMSNVRGASLTLQLLAMQIPTMENSLTTINSLSEESLNNPPFSWPDVEILMKNSFFSRRWIVQECILAKKLRLLCDGLPVSWTLLGVVDNISGIAKLEAAGLRDFNERSALSRIVALTGGRERYQSRTAPASIGSCLVRFKDFQAKRSHDNIYALLALCDTMQMSTIIPDYGKSITEVYAQAVLATLASGSWITFSIVGNSAPQSSEYAKFLPSWTPDLDREARILYDTIDYHTRGYQAGSGFPTEFRVSGDSKQLVIRGVWVDRIKVCGQELDIVSLSSGLRQSQLNDMKPLEYVTGLIRKNEEVNDIVRTHLGDIESDSNLKERLWRTLCEDFDGSNFPADPDFGIVYDISKTTQNLGLLEEFYSHDPTIAEVLEDIDKEIEHNPELEFVKSVPDFGSCGSSYFRSHKFALTESGYMAVVPSGTQPGDEVVVMQGAPAPHILRRNVDDKTHIFWGEAYVHGIMNGEAMEMEKNWFILV